MNVKITVAVEDYRPSYANKQNGVLLQSPISPARLPGKKLLVRQEQGERKNEVTMMKPEELTKLDSGPRSTYAHGIIIRSHPRQGYRKGDAIWLRESAPLYHDKSIPRRTHIKAYNLRTWEPITVALGDVCWIPKYRKLDCGEDEEDLLTISGPLVKKYDTRTYCLAVVQRLYSRNGVVEAKRVELRELVEQDTWKYQNLTALPDGEEKIGDLFHRCLASVVPDVFSVVGLREEDSEQLSIVPLNGGMGADRAITLTPELSDYISGRSSLGVNIDYSGVDGEDDPDMVRRILELERKVVAKQARKPKPLIPAGPPPEGICNLHHKCPTPPKVFFQANMPTLENLYPRHHHLEDHRCPIGAAHELHCVFQFRRDINPNSNTNDKAKEGDTVDKRHCIVPPNIRHTCCATNAWPKNKRILPPPRGIMEVDEDEVIRRGGRGTVYVVSERPGESDYSDLPVEVREVGFVPAWDLDEWGRRLFGYREKVEMVEREGVAERNRGEEWTNGCGGVDGDGDDSCRVEVYTRHFLPGPYVSGPSYPSGQLMYGHKDAQAGFDTVGSASMPIVLDDSSDDDDEAMEEEDFHQEVAREEEEESPDVFGDRHFYGDDDIDEKYGDAAGVVFGGEMVTDVY
ncbi:hypothetical protein VPNG_03518 [Cytospora leucostoma]|uniref:Uncharacterized protein n=1 Tax=Cytospora leucostoma TaxID=1230097 RepID=A0A423XD18_9PEZI|nr:hypothetical protein VPNG_03518 [Cytospora leucostoma]